MEETSFGHDLDCCEVNAPTTFKVGDKVQMGTATGVVVRIGETFLEVKWDVTPSEYSTFSLGFARRHLVIVRPSALDQFNELEVGDKFNVHWDNGSRVVTRVKVNAEQYIVLPVNVGGRTDVYSASRFLNSNNQIEKV